MNRRTGVPGVSRAWKLVDSRAASIGGQVRGAQRAGCLSESLEQRLELGQPALLGVGDRRAQPGVDSHRIARLSGVVFREIAMPSRSGRVTVISCGWVLRRSL